MGKHNKNCFRSQGGAVIEMKFRQSDSGQTIAAGFSHVVFNDESSPPKPEVLAEGHGLNKRYYFYD
jgi:hypothetical protein